MTLAYNRADSGGAVYLEGLQGPSTLSWSGTTLFLENFASYFGGALHLYGWYQGRVSASWSGTTVFLENSSGGDGGAIAMESGSISWSGNTTPVHNRAGHGGATSMTKSYLLDGSNASWGEGMTQFLGNNASSEGGALYVDTSEVSWSGRTTFVENLAGSSGAIHLINGSSVAWTGETEFTSNEASTGDGGVISSTSLDSFGLNSRESTLAVYGATTFVNNTCGANGGALALHGGLFLDIGMVNVSFVENVARVAGGAVFISGTDVGPIFIGVSFISNSAQVGGAVSAVGSGNFREESNYGSNTWPTTFYLCQFIDNSAVATGGAIESAAGQDLFDGTIFRGNQGGVGGALRLAGTSYLYDCSFVENTSDDAEGAAVSNIGSILAMGNISFSRNVFDCQPGMFLNYTVSYNAVSIILVSCRLSSPGSFGFREVLENALKPVGEPTPWSGHCTRGARWPLSWGAVSMDSRLALISCRPPSVGDRKLHTEVHGMFLRFHCVVDV